MFIIQRLREGVYERLAAAAESLLQRLEKGEAAAEIPVMRALLTEQLMAAAEEIVALLEKTVTELENRAERSEQEMERRRKAWDALLKPHVKLHRTGRLPAFCPRNRRRRWSALPPRFTVKCIELENHFYGCVMMITRIDST